MSQTATKKPPALKRLRGMLVAAFAAAGVTAGGTALWHAQAPDTPYQPPHHAAALHLPDAACAETLARGVLPTAPRGNGQPVLVLPGFLGSDYFMQPLSDKIAAAGYAVYGWAQGVNTGTDAEKARALGARLAEIAAKHPDEKVTLVGYSLGGVYARELARIYPDKVSQVITLGAPFALTDRKGAPDAVLTRSFNAFNGHAAGDTRMPPPVPTTSIFGTQDRIVNWRASLNGQSALAENIPVAAGHWSLTKDDRTAQIILHRLALPAAGNWQPLAPRLCASAAP